MAKKKSYHTIDELLEQQRQKAFSDFSVGDNKEYHTIDEIKKAATEQGLLTERAPVTQPSAQTTSGRRNLMIRNNQIKNDSRQWKQNQVDGSNPFDLRNQVYKTQNETIPRIAQQAASDYVKNRMGYNYISQYGDDTRYSDVSSDINRVQQLKGGAARRGKDTEVYDRALDMLKDYASYNRNLAETMTVDEVRAKKNESTDQKDQDRENYTWLANYNNGDIIAQDAKEGEQNRLKAEQLTQYFKDQYGIDNVSLENAVDFGSKSRSSDIAYFDEDGEAVTWDNYLRIKSAETKLNDISNNKDVNDIYSKNVTDYDDINQIDKAIDMVNLSFSDATDNNTPTISTDEQRAVTAYLSDKYNIDFSKDVNDVLTDLNNVRAEVENQFESDRESLSQAGYDWEELNYYNQYVKDKEEYQRRKAENEQFATEHPVAATLSSIAVAPAKVFDLAQNVAESFKSNDADETSALGLSNIYNDYNVNTANQYTSKVSQNINESVKESTNSDVLAWLASNSYSGISSSAQSAMTNAACVAMFGPQAGEVVALGLMGTEAAADGFNNAVRNGSNNKEALFSALATGVNEVMFEKLSFDHLMKMKGNLDTKSLKGFVKSALKSSPEMLVQGLVEADEEVNTDIANTITDYIINGNHSEYNNSIERYISQGYSKEEAEKLASEDKWKQLLESAYGGFIGGATAGSGKVAVNTAKAAVNSVSNRAERNQYIRNVGEDVTGAGNAQALLDRAAQIDDPAVKAQAQRTQQALDKATQNSTKSTNNRLSRETGKLYAAMQDSTAQGIQNAEANEIKAAIKSAYAAETGETDSAEISKAADAIYKSEYTDERLTRSERNLAETAAAQSALESVKNNPDLIESATQKAQERGFRDYVETAKLTQKQEQETKTDDDVDIDEFNYHEDDGKVYTSDGKKQVDIASVASIGDNDITFNLNDGQTESAKALDMPTNQAVLAQSILDVQKKIGVPLTADIANTLYQGYEQSDSPSVSAYMQDAQTVLFNGYANNTAPDSSINLPQELRDQLYRMGRQLAASHTQAQQQNVNARVKGNNSRKGTVTFQDGINRNKLDPRRRAGVDAVEHLAQSLGFDVVFYRSTKDGKGRFSSEYVRKNKFVADGQQAPSGFWRGGKMYLDINAGMNGEGLILFTASHELVHMIREGSPEDFKALSDFLVQNYAEQGVDINDLVRKEMARSTNLTRDQALEEVIAESCETFLRDTTLNDKAQELYKQNPTLWSRIREALKRIVDAVKQWYSVARPQSEEARITMRADVETLENAYDLWTKGIIKSAENLRNMESERTDTKYQGRAESTDTEYLDAVERGEMETAQRMVDEAAEEAGYTIKAYHGTNAIGIKDFDKNKIGESTGVSFYGRGFYFTSSERDAVNYGKNVLPVYLKMENTLDIDDDEWVYKLGLKDYKDIQKVTRTSIENLGNGFYNIAYQTDKDGDKWHYINRATVYQVGDDKGKGFVERRINDNTILPRDIKGLSELAEKHGYDSIKGAGTNIGDVGTEYVVFNSNQVKSADPVTYDDKGDVIPLSERFNESNKDIRYQSRDDDYLNAVEEGDMETAQRMVDEAAKAAGYNTPMLYHGTQNFGFTQFDLNKMDDKMSIFLTSTPETASTYSGVTGKRGISEKYFNKNLFDMSANELVKTANQFINEREKGRDIEYRYYTKNDLLKMADEVQDGLSRLKNVAEEVGPEYANKAMRDFDDSALRAHTIINNMLNDIKNGERYNWIGSAINQLANETDEFNTPEFKKLSDTLFVLGEIQDSGILRAGEEEAILRVRPDLLLYEYESNVRVAHELQKKMSRGNYATYAKLDNPLIIDAKGARWNQIPITDQMWDSLTMLQKGWDKQGNKISYTRSIAEYAKKHGYDGVVFKNLEDNGGLNDLVHTAKSDVYVVFNPSQVKSADPVTYDDNGDVIPLSQRFDSTKTDIRYQSRDDDLFSTDDMFDDDSISSTVAREYITHHEDIGEVLRNISDIELPSSKVQSIVNRVIRNELGYLDEEARRTLSIELQLALERVSKTDAQDVSNEMINAVRKAVEGARITDERTQTSYQELRNVFKGKKYFLSDEQINQLKEHDMTFDDFRKAMFGKVTIVKRENAKRSINGGYADAQQLSLEGLHDVLDNPEEILGIRRDEWDNKNYDAPYIIKNAFDTLREQQSQLVTDMYSDEAIDDMAIAIAAKITGDIVEAKYNSRKNPYVSKLVKDLQAKRTEAVNRQKERNKQKLAELKTKERERAEKREKELTEHYKEQRAKNVQKRNLTKQKDVVARKLRSLDKKLNRSNKDKTVKEGLRPTAAKLLEVGNMLFPETRSLEEMARDGVSDATPAEKKLLDKYVTYLDMRERAATKEQRESASNMLAYIRKQLSKEGIPVEVTENGKTVKKKMSVTARERMRYDNSMRDYNKLKLRTALTELEDAYSMVKNSPDGYIADSFDPKIIDLIKDLKNDVGDTLAKDMTSAQLQTLNDIVTRALKSITNANKLFLQSKSMTDTAAAVMNDIKHIRKLKDMRNLPMYKAGEFLGWTNFKPIYAMRFIGSDTLTQLYWNIQRGESNWYVDIAEAKEFKDKLDEKYGVGKLNTKNKTDFNYNKKATFTALDGSEFTLNLDQMMDIYAASRRKQALQHLLKGGFTFAKDAKGDKFGTLKTGAKVYQLTAETISNIADQLTVNEKKYVEDMQKYLSTVMADKGNEVSMQLHGVKLFNEEIYWSISSTDIYAPQNEVDQEQKTDLVKKIRNAGFTKSTVKNASNPIVVQGFEEKWAGHVNEMSLYHAMTLPLEDFTKVVNYRQRGRDAKATTGVRGVLNQAYGNAASNYINQLIDDLNGGIQQRMRVGVADTLVSLAKKGAVLTNLSVVIQQPSAMFRAMAYINPRYFVKATGNKFWSFEDKRFSWTKHNKAYEELIKYAPIAGIKRMGSFDTGAGRGVIDYLSSGGRENLAQRAYRKSDDIASFMPEYADELAWIKIWQAAQHETQARYGYKVGTEQNKVKAGERFTEVVHLTQVYDSTLSRSHAMRGKDFGSKMLTSFMAEPTTYMNMAVDAVVQSKRTHNFKQLAKTMSGLSMALIANALLVAIPRAMRDDDEEETFADKYLQAFWDDIISGVNPLNYFPILKDIMSTIEGHSNERMDMTIIGNTISSITKAFENIQKGKFSGNDVINILGAAAACVGFSLKNLVRDIRSVINTVNTFKNAHYFKEVDEMGLSLPYAYQKAYDKAWEKGYSEEECKSKAETAARSKIANALKSKYLEAVESNDTESVKEIRQYMLQSGYYHSKKKNGSDLSAVDDTLASWRKKNSEASERANTAEERQKSE